MHFYGMWPWKVLNWPWFWPKVAVKDWRDLATLIQTMGRLGTTKLHCMWKYVVNIV
jgi:hypothetical protein